MFLFFGKLSRSTVVFNTVFIWRYDMQAFLLELVDLNKETTCMQTVVSYVSFFFCDIRLFELLLFLLLRLS